MKKLLALTLALLMILSSVAMLSSCKKDDEEGTKKLILGFDATYPPYGYIDEKTQSYVGFDIDYAKKVCEKLGYELELRPITWDAKDIELNSGSIDLIWNGFTYEGREDKYEWTDRYQNSSIVVLVKESSGINTLADLAGKIVTVQTESSGEAALKDKPELVATFKDAKYVTDADYVTAFEKLKTGGVEAIAVDVGVANNLVKNNEGYKILGEVIKQETYGVAFKKGNTELRDEFNRAMKEVAEDTEFMDELFTKYEAEGFDRNAFILGK